ncbi:MAG: hypothetical protein V2J55_14925 [Candidatus Competibacteraceae bacterium]|nr:hypothetical protein [Candidatus Competibacteraceae bacterium]
MRTQDSSRFVFVIPLIMLISALTVILLYLIYYAVSDNYANRTALTLTGNALTVSVGQGEISGDALEVRQVSSQGVAFASITGITLSADTYSALRWTIDGFQDDVVIDFIWATQTDPGNMQKVQLTPSNDSNALNLNAESSWQGTIVGMGIMVTGHLSDPVIVHQLKLQQSDKPALMDFLGRFWSDWTFLETWSQRSVNFIEGMPHKALMPIVPAVALWISLCFAIYLGLFFTRRVPLTLVPFTVFILTGWLILDARWQWTLWNQLESTKTQFGDKTPEQKRLAGEDGGLFQFILEVKKFLPAEPTRLFIITADPYEGTRYLRSRARYHLLPHNVFSLLSALPQHYQPGDYLLVFPPLQDLQYDRNAQLLKDKHNNLPAKLVHQTASGALFRMQDRPL